MKIVDCWSAHCYALADGKTSDFGIQFIIYLLYMWPKCSKFCAFIKKYIKKIKDTNHPTFQSPFNYNNIEFWSFPNSGKKSVIPHLVFRIGSSPAGEECLLISKLYIFVTLKAVWHLSLELSRHNDIFNNFHASYQYFVLV